MFQCTDLWVKGGRVFVKPVCYESLIKRTNDEGRGIKEQLKELVELDIGNDDDDITDTLLYGPRITVLAMNGHEK